MIVHIPFCRIIAADNDRPGRCRRVNIVTALPANHANQFKQYTQATGAAPHNEYPEFVVTATGGVHGITGPSRNLTTIYIPGYTGPQLSIGAIPMAKTTKQKLFDDLNVLIDKYPNAKVSDVIIVLESFTEALWHALPAPKKGRKVIERTARYRMV